MNAISKVLDAMVRTDIAPVFSLYVMSRVREGLRSDDPGRPVELTLGEMKTIGDCRYAQHVSDSDGNNYRVTVEVIAPNPGSRTDAGVKSPRVAFPPENVAHPFIEEAESGRV